MKIEMPKKIYVWSLTSISLLAVYLIGLFIWGLVEVENTLSLISTLILTSLILGLLLYPLIWIIKNYKKGK